MWSISNSSGWPAQVGRGDRRRKKSKTGECCSCQTLFSLAMKMDNERKSRQEKMVATAQLMLALTKGVVNVGVVLSLNPF